MSSPADTSISFPSVILPLLRTSDKSSAGIIVFPSKAVPAVVPNPGKDVLPLLVIIAAA